MAEPIPVWVVDDDRAVRFVLAAALREAGFERLSPNGGRKSSGHFLRQAQD